MKKEMKVKDAVELYKAFEGLGIQVWIDGGWAMDALLGEQTRPHKDFDIVMAHKDIPKLQEYLEGQGYKEIERPEDQKWTLVLGDEQGHEVDIHGITFDEKGHVREKDEFSGQALTGKGSIEGYSVKCIEPAYLVELHTRYEPRPQDYVDVPLLCDKFGIEYPEKYRHLKK